MLASRNILRCTASRLYCQVRFQTSQSPLSAAHTSPLLNRPISQPTHFTHPHLLSASEVTPGITREEFVDRRKRLSDALPSHSFSIFPSNSQFYMSEDVPFAYHPNTDLMYTTGVAEPGAILIAHRDEAQTRFTLCVPPRDTTRELWDGARCGPSDDVRSYFAVDEIRLVDELPQLITAALPSMQSFHFDPLINPDITRLLSSLKAPEQRALVRCWRRNAPPKMFLLPLRLVKSPAEQALLRRATAISAASVNDAMAAFRTTKNSDAPVAEAAIDAVLTYECMFRRGATRMAFPSVVAAGHSATILHYMRKDASAAHGDLIMVDTGCELHGYCADISRTWPISGRFSSAQRDLYAMLVEAHSRCISIAREGAYVDDAPVSLDQLHDVATHILTDGLLQLGFLKGHSVESAMATGAYANYFPHAIGHFLGLDVHDTHLVEKNITLRRGMVITVEPGLYCMANDESAPPAFRGIGMRLEDDVIVGDPSTPPEVISEDAVKEIDDIEAIVGSHLR